MKTTLLQRASCGFLVLVGLMGSAKQATASIDDDRLASRFVEAQLPKGTNLLNADGVMMARAVGRAVLDHRAQAPDILSVALKGGARLDADKSKPKIQRTCNFVVRVYKAALLAAPEQASRLTEDAAALYPDCADQLAAVLRGQDQRVAAYDYKDRPDYKDRGDYKDRTDYKDSTNAPVAGISDLGDPDTGFGIGFGPGFPGAPGFVGSPPSGGFALPPVVLPTPGTQPVTSVVNQ